MSHVTVNEILQKIDQLPSEERMILEQELAQRAEREWREAAEEARRIARERGLDQAAIDKAVHDVRYGK
jgi:hypothetical protein